LTIVGSPHRTTPAWDGKVYPVAGVETPEGTVLSVPPDAVEATRAAGEDLATIGPVLPGIVGRADARFGRGVFRWCQELLNDSDPDAGGLHLPPQGQTVWLKPEDERVPPWLAVFNGDVLVHLDEDGRYGAGVGRKRHDNFGQELSVATEQHLQGRGLARRLVAQAARRVAEEGAVATYLHAPNNVASAHVAEAAGFPDTGWWILGVPVAS
jgi:GNAT superfamily N-acetyltransferase